jgi:hypothetical protein
MRPALLTLAIAGFLANAAVAQSSQSQDSQSQDSQSVAEAARRARENKKKAEAKPGKVFTDDDVKPAAPAGSAAAPAGTASSAETGPGRAAGTSGAGPEDEQKAKDIAALKEQIKQVQGDLDLLKREQALQRDTYYSNPDYVHDTAGKAKLDDIKQRVADKQGELDSLKDRLAELGGTMDTPAAAPGAPAAGSAPAATPPQS